MNINAPFAKDISGYAFDEILQKSGLDFTVSKKVLLRSIYDDKGEVIDTTPSPFFELLRDDTRGVVSSKPVGSDFTTLQNHEAFEWFRPFVEAGEVTMDRAGQVFKGSKVFFTAKINGRPLEVRKNDEIEKYITLINPHDGLTAIRVGFVPYRIFCQNMLASVVKGKSSQFIRLKHHRLVKLNLEQVRETIDVVNKQFAVTEELYKSLDRVGINQKDLEKYIQRTFGMEEKERKDGEVKLATRSQNILNEILDNYERERQGREIVQEMLDNRAKSNASLLDEILDNYETQSISGGSNGTWYDAYNAVTRYQTHKFGRSADSRVDQTLVNPVLPARALTVATEMAGI